MTTVVRTWRIVGAAVIIAALIGNTYKHVTEHYFAFFDTYGYFSQQSSILAAVLLIVLVRYTGLPRPAWLEYARASVLTYQIVVVAVYWGLLGGFEAGDPVKWSTAIMHGGALAIVLVDWLVEGPRTAQRLRYVWTIMVYPLVWITVALIRGATDGWVPYPFLDPTDGYAPVAVVVGGLVVAGMVVGAALLHLTSFRVVVPADAS